MDLVTKVRSVWKITINAGVKVMQGKDANRENELEVISENENESIWVWYSTWDVALIQD